MAEINISKATGALVLSGILALYSNRISKLLKNWALLFPN